MAPPLSEIADIQLQLIDPKGIKGWVGLVGWHTADGLPTCHPSAISRAQDREVRRPKTDVLPLCHTTSHLLYDKKIEMMETLLLQTIHL